MRTAWIRVGYIRTSGKFQSNAHCHPSHASQHKQFTTGLRLKHCFIPWRAAVLVLLRHIPFVSLSDDIYDHTFSDRENSTYAKLLNLEILQFKKNQFPRLSMRNLISSYLFIWSWLNKRLYQKVLEARWEDGTVGCSWPRDNLNYFWTRAFINDNKFQEREDGERTTRDTVDGTVMKGAFLGSNDTQPWCV